MACAPGGRAGERAGPCRLTCMPACLIWLGKEDEAKEGEGGESEGKDIFLERFFMEAFHVI